MLKNKYKLKVRREKGLKIINIDELLNRMSITIKRVMTTNVSVDIDGNNIILNKKEYGKGNGFNFKITVEMNDENIFIDVENSYERRAEIFMNMLKDLLKGRLFQIIKDEKIKLHVDVVTNKYNVILVNNPSLIEDKNSFDFRYFEKEGIILKGKLIDDIVDIEDIDTISIGEIHTLYKENDTEKEKFMKKFIEYVSYGFVNESLVSSLKETFPKVKILTMMTMDEYIEFCNGLVSTDKAIDSNVIDHISKFITLDYKDIKNKEMKVLKLLNRLSDENDNLDDINGYELIRLLNKIIVKNENGFFHKRKGYKLSHDNFTPLDEIDMKLVCRLLSFEDKLYPYTNTYRDTLIAYKIYLKNSEVNTLINRSIRKGKNVSKISSEVKYDIDLLKGYSIGNVPGLEELSLKRLFKLFNVITKNSFYAGAGMKDYFIRNGKIFLDKSYKNKREYVFVTPVINEIKRRLDSIKEEIILPEEYKSPIIMSDKKKVGNVYFGSAIKIGYNYAVGVKWYSDMDLDISMQFDDLKIINYCDERRNGIYFSGDCRHNGSEYIKFVDKDMETNTNGLIRASLFDEGRSKEEDRKFKIFILDDNDNVVFETEYINIVKRQNSVAVISDGYCCIDVRAESNEDTVIYNEYNEDILSLYLNQPKVLLENILDHLEIPYRKVNRTELQEDEEYFDINKY